MPKAFLVRKSRSHWRPTTSSSGTSETVTPPPSPEQQAPQSLVVPRCPPAPFQGNLVIGELSACVIILTCTRSSLPREAALAKLRHYHLFVSNLKTEKEKIACSARLPCSCLPVFRTLEVTVINMVASFRSVLLIELYAELVIIGCTLAYLKLSSEV